MIEQKETLCNDCAKACNGKCSWSESLTPVNGWKVTESKPSVIVEECPEYVREDRRLRSPEDIDSDGMMLLLEALVKSIRFDYVYGLAETRIGIEKWLRSKHAQRLLGLTDTEDLIRKLRKMIRNK